jgi:hypothetical protein
LLGHRAGSARPRPILDLSALVASSDPHRKAFYRDLLTRHNARKQALIAFARKLFHAVYRILKTVTAYDGNKLFLQNQP